MKPLLTLRLHYALPLLLVSAFAALLLFSMAYQYRQAQSDIETKGYRELQEIMANTQRRIETFLQYRQPALLEEEMARFGVDLTINSALLSDENGSVILATRLEWLGRNYLAIHPDWPKSLCPDNPLKHKQAIQLTANREQLLGCHAVVIARTDGQIRPTRFGYLLVDYDLSSAKAASWNLLVQSMYPVWLVGLLLMLTSGGIIQLWVDRPLRHLGEVVTAFSAGDYSRKCNLSGRSELATLGKAWNQMAGALQETLAQLEESRERLEVTLLSIGDAVIATDTDGRITFINQVAQTLTGWKMADACGQALEQVFVVINIKTRQKTDNPLRQVIASGKIIGLANDTALLSRDGQEYLIADSAAPIFSKSGETLGAILVFRDVTEEYRLRAQLANEQALLRSLIDAVPDLIFYKDTAGRYLGCNKAFEGFAGYSERQLIGLADHEFFDAERAQGFCIDDVEAIRSGRPHKAEARARYPDGRQILLDVIRTPFHDRDGNMLGLVGISRDVTERRRYEEKLAASEERIRSLGNNLPDGYIYQCQQDCHGVPTFTFISNGVEKVNGVSVASVLCDPNVLLKQIDREQQPAFLAALRASRLEMSDFSMELCIQHPRNGRRWIQMCSRPRVVDARIVWDGVVLDVTEKKANQEQIWRQANFDPLTELPNRQMFHQRLNQEIKQAHRGGQSFALLFIDLDRFKEINDTLGHMLGDQLLQIAAERLLNCVRDTDTVARLGGDEFTVILAGIENIDGVSRVASNILQNMAQPFSLHDEQVYVSASIGITLFPQDAGDAEQLLQNADHAMYAAKAQGRNRYGYFTSEMQNAVQRRLDLSKDLRHAIQSQQFEVFFQPIVELSSGRIAKAEALIRWHHPDKGPISPGLFIPVAEENGMILEIGDWVFKQAAQHLQTLRAVAASDFQISINKSPAQFRNAQASAQEWLAYLQRLGLPGDSVVIEITEGLLLDTSASTSQILHSYQTAGIQISLDDFGTGYSSLAYIQKFDIDFLKIDQGFIAELNQDSTNLALCEAIILMAHKLDIKVVAEGVETDQQRDLLNAIGCDYAQGYLFSRPLPIQQLIALLNDQPGTALAEAAPPNSEG